MNELWGIMAPAPSKGLAAGKPPLGARPEGGGDKGAKPPPPSNPNLGGAAGVEAAAAAAAAAEAGATAAAYIAICLFAGAVVGGLTFALCVERSAGDGDSVFRFAPPALFLETRGPEVDGFQRNDLAVVGLVLALAGVVRSCFFRIRVDGVSGGVAGRPDAAAESAGAAALCSSGCSRANSGGFSAAAWDKVGSQPPRSADAAEMAETAAAVPGSAVFSDGNMLL
jgi:hypothetical protein